MSSDFAFWKSGTGDPEEIFEALSDGDTSGMESSADVQRFRDELLTSLPDVGDALEPSDFDLAESPDDGRRYVLLTLSVRQLDHLPRVLELAQKHRLRGFSGVAGEAIEPIEPM